MNTFAKKFGMGLLLLCILSLICYTPDLSWESLKPLYAQSPSQFIEMDGRRVHYRDEGSGEAIVLIHGTGASLHTWDAWATQLKTQYRVIRFDLPAYGLTGADPQKRYTVDDYVVLLEKLVQKWDLENFHLAGNSLGGQVAWQYAAQHSQRVNKLVLLNAAGFPSKKSPWVIQLARTPLLNLFVRYCTPRSFIEKNLKEVYHNDQAITAATIDRYYDLTRLEGNRQAFIDRAYLEKKDATGLLSKIQAPTLVLWGAEDAWIPVANAEKFAQRIPHSELRIMPETGHVPMEEQPEASLRRVLDFLEQESVQK